MAEALLMTDAPEPTDETPYAAAAVIVVGSLHYDIMVDAPDRPRKGETVTGRSWAPKFGGKGGNQAVAARRQGVSTAMSARSGRIVSASSCSRVSIGRKSIAAGLQCPTGSGLE